MENQFNAGDLVWAKVHRHPWWPCIIYHEALTSTETQQAKKDGFVLVSFFGDSSYKWLGPKNLLPFESNYSVYSTQSKSRLFVKAVNEAVYEVNYRAAIGLTCHCSFFSHCRPSPVDGLLEVDVDGYKLGGVSTVQQIEQLRQEFRPVEMVSFLQQLALDSTDVHQNLKHSKEVARVLAFRKANYAEVDEPYFTAFGVDPRRPGDPIVASDDQEMTLIQAPNDQPSEAEIQDQEIAKVRRQIKNKRCLVPATQIVKVHATKTKCSVIRNKHHESNKSSPDNLPKKKRHMKVESDKKLVKSECSPSPSKEPWISKEDDKKFKSSTTIKMFNDVDFVQSSKTSTPSKTCHAHKDSPPASKSLKNGKRKRSAACTGETQVTCLTLSHQNNGKKEKNQEGPKMMLSIKFPRGTTLPSVSELKAKFARFGPLDTSGIHVSWFESRCWVAFMNQGDAEEAYEHAVNFKKLFAPDVTYRLFSLVSRSNLHEDSVSERNAVKSTTRGSSC